MSELYVRQRMNTLIDIITFAWRGSGKYVFITCVILSVVADLASLAPVIGAITAIFIAGYFCAPYYQLIQSSATGGMEAPDFPNVSNIFEDIIWPMLQSIVVGLVSFGPFLAYSVWAGSDSANPAILYGLFTCGVIYFPMAMLAVVVLGYTGALSPHIVLPAIFSGGRVYWIGVILLVLLYSVDSMVQDLFSRQFIVRHLLMALVGSYTFMTNARILGVVYRERQEELGWN